MTRSEQATNDRRYLEKHVASISSSSSRDVVDGKEKEEDDDQLKQIEEQLESLNDATDDINSIELRLEAARNRFRETRASWSRELSELSRKQSSSIAKARKYYELKSEEHDLRREAQKAAEAFEKTSSILEMTRDQMVVVQDTLARDTDPMTKLQYTEVLSQQIDLVREAETECEMAEAQHAAKVASMLRMEQALQKAVQENRNSIKKARLYYEKRATFTKYLEAQLELIVKLEEDVQRRKDSYNTSLRTLERISEQIHEQRSRIFEESGFDESEKMVKNGNVFDENDTENVDPAAGNGYGR